MRVYFCGAHSTGKTTLARLVAKRYGLALLSEVARTVLAEMEYVGGLPAMAGDVESVTEYQRAVWHRQARVESAAGDDYVSDRMADSLAYSALRAAPGTVASLMAGEVAEGSPYAKRVRGGTVFFVRPHLHLLREDGVRTDVDWEGVVRMDGAILMLLSMLDVPYVPISCPEVSDRLRVVEGVLGVPVRPG